MRWIITASGNNQDGLDVKRTPTKHKIQEIASTTPHFSCNMKMAKIPVITGAEKVNVVASPAGI